MKRLKGALLIIGIIIAVALSFYTKYSSLINDFKITAESKTLVVNEHIRTGVAFIDSMTQYGNDYHDKKIAVDSKYLKYVEYNSVTRGFDMDTVGGIAYGGYIGNLTGIGPIPLSGNARDELNLALVYNTFFGSFYSRLSDVAWLYYTSNNNFMTMYPWVSSETFKFSESVKSDPFFLVAAPINNPSRAMIWTSLYLDKAGRGLVVTLSSPIYFDDTFVGVLSLDLTTEKMNKFINSSYETYLVDSKNNVIAATQGDLSANVITDLKTISKRSDNFITALKDIKGNSVQYLGPYYVYSSSIIDAPWTLYVFVSVGTILGQSALASLPILLIGFMLLYTRKTSILLHESLIELKSYEDKLENAAKFDFLTNTFNRRGLKEGFAAKMLQVQKYRIPVSFMLGDIDNFKRFNDTYGHYAGDKVLIEITNLMKDKINENDIVCRWGGEEILIMLFDRTFDKSIEFAEFIRKSIEDMNIEWENTDGLKVTMSFGVAPYDYGDSIDASIALADTAMYIAKQNGRNQVISDIKAVSKKSDH